VARRVLVDVSENKRNSVSHSKLRTH